MLGNSCAMYFSYFKKRSATHYPTTAWEIKNYKWTNKPCIKFYKGVVEKESTVNEPDEKAEHSLNTKWNSYDIYVQISGPHKMFSLCTYPTPYCVNHAQESKLNVAFIQATSHNQTRSLI